MSTPRRPRLFMATVQVMDTENDTVLNGALPSSLFYQENGGPTLAAFDAILYHLRRMPRMWTHPDCAIAEMFFRGRWVTVETIDWGESWYVSPRRGQIDSNLLNAGGNLPSKRWGRLNN